MNAGQLDHLTQILHASDAVVSGTAPATSDAAQIVEHVLGGGYSVDTIGSCSQLVGSFLQSQLSREQLEAQLASALTGPRFPGAPELRDGAIITVETHRAPETTIAPELVAMRAWDGDFSACDGSAPHVCYGHPSTKNDVEPFRLELVLHVAPDGSASVSCAHHFLEKNVARVDPTTGEFCLSYASGSSVTTLSGRLNGNSAVGRYSKKNHFNITVGQKSGYSSGFSTRVAGGVGGLCVDDRGVRNQAMYARWRAAGKRPGQDLGGPIDNVHQLENGLIQTFQHARDGHAHKSIIALRDGANEAVLIREGLAEQWLADRSFGYPVSDVTDDPLGPVQLFEHGYAIKNDATGWRWALFPGRPEPGIIGVLPTGQVLQPLRDAVAKLNRFSETFSPQRAVQVDLPGGAYQVFADRAGRVRYVTLGDGENEAHYLDQRQWDTWHRLGGPAVLGWPIGGDDTLSQLCGYQGSGPGRSYTNMGKVLPFKEGGIIMSLFSAGETKGVESGKFYPWSVVNSCTNCTPSYKHVLR